MHFIIANINLNFKLETQETNLIIYIITIAAVCPACHTGVCMGKGRGLSAPLGQTKHLLCGEKGLSLPRVASCARSARAAHSRAQRAAS